MKNYIKKDLKKWQDFIKGKDNPKREERIKLSKHDKELRAKLKAKRKAHKEKYFWKHIDLT